MAKYYCKESRKEIDLNDCFVYDRLACRSCKEYCKQSALKKGRHTINNVDGAFDYTEGMYGGLGGAIEDATYFDV